MAKIDEKKWKELLQILNELKRSDSGIYLGTLSPHVDVVVDGDKVKIAVDMPGVYEVKILVDDEGRILHIRARGDDRRYWSLTRLPVAVNHKGTRHRYKNGILYIEMPIKKQFTLTRFY